MSRVARSLVQAGAAGARGVSILTVIASVAFLASCGDDGPSGPGSYEVEITRSTGLPPAGVVVDLVGPGVVAAAGAGGTQVWTHPLPGGQGLRVVAVNEAGGEPLHFRLDVSDVGAPSPEGVVRMGTDADNRHITAVETYQVRLTR